MADRYWVGGTASWDGTAGTKWSATSGGAGGASVPTTADDVFFNAASGASVVTIATGNTGAKSINCTGFTGTLTGTANITVSGSITLVAGMTCTRTGILTINGTGSITSAGKTLGDNVTVDGTGITVSLADALTLSGSLTVTIGSFITNNFNVTLGNSLVSTGTNTRSINLGSSTITCQGSTAVNLVATNLTFNAETSTIISNSSSPTFAGGGLTFYNVSFTNIVTGTKTITGANVFNNLSVAAPSVAGVMNVNFSERQTINGTLSTTGTAGNRRVWFRSTTYGVSQVLVVNSAASLTDTDFRDIIVIGTAAPISGTRIGDLRGNSGITFSTPKNVYRVGVGNWHDNQWAASSGGAVNTDNFPLAQDTAVMDQSTSAGTVTATSNVPYCGSIDMSLRTTALGLSMVAALTLYGNLTLGSGITMTNSAAMTFSGRSVQTITSAGKTFSNSLTIDTFGGTVQLVGALSMANTLTITNGAFNTAGFALTADAISSSSSNVRSINLGSSTVTLSSVTTAINFGTTTNLAFDAGTSTIIMTGFGPTLTAAELQFNNVSFTSITASGTSISGGTNTFNNLTIASPGSGAPRNITFTANQTITGTLTVTGSSLILRNFLRSSTLGTRRTITVNSLAANNCDFRDIEIAGAAAGSSPTGAGDCGNNSGLIFPAPKTVYWNLGPGAFGWGEGGWAATSGGTPNINSFALAQDTAVIDNSSAGSSLSTLTFNIGTIDASSRTTAFNLVLNGGVNLYKDLSLGTGITISSGAGAAEFVGNGTSTITSNGRTIDQPINISGTGTVQLADALTLGSTRTLTLNQGKFNPGVYNVTAGLFVSIAVSTRELLMGSGLWTLSGTGTVWNISTSNLTYNPQSANILLSDTSANARTFTGGSLYYNKLTIGGTAGTSTTTISDGNVFGELASTKTVAHTIALGTTTQTFGKWTVTGTVGNVVTLTGTGTSHIIAGTATSDIDYLAMGSIGFTATSPGEFYAGVNSTGTAAAPVYRTAKPADSIRYWVGGTGNWSNTARWSASSGGASGASVPRSHDDVVFNSASNATAYIATVDAVTGGIRCKALTVAGPASGSLTLAGSSNIVGIHGDVTLPATGLSRTYTGSITLSGSVTGRTFTTNGVALNSTMNVNGVGASWSMSDALNLGGQGLSMINGTLSTNNFTLSLSGAIADTGGLKTLNLGSSTVVFRGFGNFIQFGSTATLKNLFTFNAGTSLIDVFLNGGPNLFGNGHTFYNLIMSIGSAGGSSTGSISGSNTFNNVTFDVTGSDLIHSITLGANQTINGVLSFTGTTAIRRYFLRSNTTGTTRTVTCASFAASTDVDFRDIMFAGAAAPISGTRFGDCKGNSGITFPSPKTVYWNLAAGGSWQSTAWATSSGGTPDVNNFPLAQDTAIIENTGLNSAATISISTAFNISAIDMSNRSTAMTFSSAVSYTIYGNLTLGSGVTIAGPATVTVTFSGRATQTLTTAGKSITFAIAIDSPGGSVALQDSLTLTGSGVTIFDFISGTFDTNSYNVTTTGSTAQLRASAGTLSRTLVFGSETWTLSSSATVWTGSTNLTISGTRTGSFNLTSASAKTFQGGGIDYGNITINNGGAGALTITGNNRFKDLTATQTATSAATIALGATVQSLAQFSGSGQAGRLLTITGTSAVTPATLIFTGTGIATNTAVDYLTLIGIRAYPTTDTWYAGNNSITTTSTGTLGWIYASSVAPTAVTSGNFLMFAMP